jgi:large subunit ribosomal protein L21
MYAIVDVKDKQFKVREDDTLYVPYHSDADEDQELTLDRVLLVSDGDGDVTLGTPTVKDASVSARVLEHVKGDKVIVFKKKRRKRYRVKRGHRQQYTQIKIESLNVNGAAATGTEETAESVPDAEDSSSEPATDETEDSPSDEADAADASEAEAPATEEAEADDASDDEEATEADDSEADVDDSTEASADTGAASDSEDNPFDQETAFDDVDDLDEEKTSGDSEK